MSRDKSFISGILVTVIFCVVIAGFVAKHERKVHGQITAPATTGMVSPVASGAGIPSTFLTCNAAANNLWFVNTLTNHPYYCNGSTWTDMTTVPVSPSSFTLGGNPLTFLGLLNSTSTTPASIGPSGCADTSFTFTGLQASAAIGMPTPPSSQTTNIMLSGVRVTGVNTLSIRFCNEDLLTTRAPVAGVYTILAAW